MSLPSSPIPSTLEQRRLLSEQINLTLQSPRQLNEFGQPVLKSEPDWVPAQLPKITILQGKYVHLVPLSVEQHLDDLWSCFEKVEDSYYTYLFHGPFHTKEEMAVSLDKMIKSEYYYMAIIDNDTQRAVGYINLMRIDPNHGCIEVGAVCFSPLLQKNRKGTEVVWLLMKYIFEDLHYRRFEWKCDSQNIPSRRAALRFGFVFEGLFRKHVVYRGRMRDTTWFSITDDEYKEIMIPSYTEYLNESNFDENGVQIKSLPQCREMLRQEYDERWVAGKELVEKDLSQQSKE